MNRTIKLKKNWVFLLALLLVLVMMQTGIWAASTDKAAGYAIVGREIIQSFSGGKLCKVMYSDQSCQDVVVYNNGTIEVYDPDKHGALFGRAKISKALQAKLDQADSDGLIPVAIWVSDIDIDSIDKAVKKDLGITSLQKISKEKIDLYITTKRAKAKEAYQTKNLKFLAKYTDAETVATLVSGYAPFVIVNLDPKSITKIAKDSDVTSIDLFVDGKKEDETAYSIPNINANYTRDTIGLTGSGVNIGIVESGYANKANAQLSGQNIIFDVSDSYASTRLSTHATIVSSILVGNTQGIAPDATLYVVAALSRTQDYQKIEWLLDQGVTVINYSAGYSDIKGQYSDMAKWIDHVGNQHNVHFVKSAGNTTTSNYGISDPGMAYNALVAGSIYDHDSPNEPYWADDTLSTFSCYTETSGGYKPDLTAPGEGITVAGYTNYSGTSFSAPHAAATLTQLIDYSGAMLTNAALLKAICAAGTFHRTATDYGTAYSLSPSYSNYEGAGVVDAKAAYTIAANSNYTAVELTAAQFPYEITFNVTTVNQPIRVALAWLKQNTISASSHAGAAVTERNLSDLDLRVINPSGITVGSSVSSANNLELVEFTPSVTGTYRIRVVGYAIQNTTEKIGIAWYQRPN